jgi:superfamily II DNA helicase RecQ
MNIFLKSKKILHTEAQLISTPSGAFWTFCIKYIENSNVAQEKNVKIDYKTVLDEKCFERFSKMREVRKLIADEDAVPAFVVFTDEELALFAKNEEVSFEIMQNTKGIGEKRMLKYGELFLKKYASLPDKVKSDQKKQ